jgi:hypothetical protein
MKRIVKKAFHLALIFWENLHCIAVYQGSLIWGKPAVGVTLTGMQKPM